nr:hypothetical protein [Nanoarchaeum sp.]
MKKKSVLYLGGGGMLGVFGAGIVTSLEEENSYPYLDAVYGGSAGSFNLAYFLSRQTHFGSTIYWENLTKNFVNIKNLIPESLQIVYNRFISEIHPESMINSLNVEHAIRVVKNEKYLDIRKIKRQPIPVYVKVLDTKTGEVKFVDMKSNPLQRLREAITLEPYNFHPTQRLIDGEAISPIGIEYLLLKHPNQKIVICINYHPTEIGTKNREFRNYLDGILCSMMYPHLDLYARFRQKEEYYKNQIKKAMKEERVLLIHPPKNNPSKEYTTDPEKLKETYEMGKKAGKRVAEFLRS